MKSYKFQSSLMTSSKGVIPGAPANFLAKTVEDGPHRLIVKCANVAWVAMMYSLAPQRVAL